MGFSAQLHRPALVLRHGCVSGVTESLQGFVRCSGGGEGGRELSTQSEVAELAVLAGFGEQVRTLGEHATCDRSDLLGPGYFARSSGSQALRGYDLVRR